MGEHSRAAPRAIRSSAGGGALPLWIALAVALSPSLAELVRHWARDPWARESAVFVPIAIAFALADRTPSRPHPVGWSLVAAGLGLALFGFAGGVEPLGRVAVPLVVLGAAWAIGRPSARTALVTVFWIPPPFWIVSSLLSQGALRVPRGDLALEAADLGIPLAHLLAGLGFCAGLASGERVPRAIGRGLLWVVWAVPAQLLALAAALGIRSIAGPDAARAFLDVAPAYAVTAIAIPRLRARAPRDASRRPPLPVRGSIGSLP